jgi:tetratricopeptide (TPR) repeat protein/DNA-binding CsgD family transcriptional regulator
MLIIKNKIKILFYCLISFSATASINDTIVIAQKISKAIETNEKNVSLKLFDEAEKLARKQNNLDWQIEPTIEKGFFFYNNNEFSKSLSLYNQALTFCENNNLLKKKARILIYTSVLYSRISDHQKSYEYAFKSLKINNQLNYQKGIASALKNMADELYVDYNRTEKNFKIALKYYNQAIEIYKKRKDYSLWTSTLNNLATLYLDAKRPNEGLKILEEANEVYNLNKSNIIVNPSADIKADILCNIGYVYLSGFKNYPKAVVCIKKAIDYCDINFDYAYILSRNYLNLTEAYIHLKQYDLAKESCTKATQYALDSQDIYTQAESYLNLCKLDSINGNYKNSFSNHKLYTKLKDSIGSNEKTMLLEKLNIQFETEKVAQENKELQGKNGARIKIITVLGFLVLAILTIFYFYFKSKKAQSYLLNEKAKNLENEKRLIQLDKILEEEKNKVLIAENEVQNRAITAKNISLEQNKNTLESAYEDLRHLNKNLTKEDTELVSKLKSNIKSNLSFTDEWQSTALHFEKVHPDFFKHLYILNPNLTQNDLRQCAYIKLNLSTKEIAWILNIDSSSVRINRYRIKKKLDLAENVDLINYISSI